MAFVSSRPQIIHIFINSPLVRPLTAHERDARTTEQIESYIPFGQVVGVLKRAIHACRLRILSITKIARVSGIGNDADVEDAMLHDGTQAGI